MPKFKLWTRICLVCFILVAPLLAPPARGDYTVSITSQGVKVSLSGDLRQGVRSLSANQTNIWGKFPAFNASITNDNSSVVENPISSAIRAKAPDATVENFEMHVSSNGTLMHYELSFQVTGVTRQQDGEEIVDLSWRSFDVPGDIVLSQVSINKLVPTYLGTTIANEARRSIGIPLSQTKTWYINDVRTASSAIPSETEHLTLFNFSSLSTPLQMWTPSYETSRSVYRWENRAGFNVTFIGTISDPTATFSLARNAVYKVDTIIEAPLGARVSNDQVRYDASPLPTWLMIGIILGSATVLISSTLAERQVQSSRNKRSRGKKV